jgi:hypothetical protein
MSSLPNTIPEKLSEKVKSLCGKMQPYSKPVIVSEIDSSLQDLSSAGDVGRWLLKQKGAFIYSKWQDKRI